MRGVSDASVILVGNATHDSMYFVGDLPTNDEVSAVDRRVTCLGGRGVVPALVVSALGVHASLCTVIGSDARDEFDPFLRAHGVETTAVKWDPGGSSTTEYVAFIGESQGNSLAVANPPSLDWAPSAVQREAVASADVVYFSTNDLSFNAALLSAMGSREQVVIHNLGVRIRTNPSYVELMLPKTTILIGNRVEIAQLVEQTRSTPEEVLERAPSLKNIIVTRGPEGVLVYRKGEPGPQSLPGRKAERVVSPVGAGDSLAAGLLATIAKGGAIDDGLDLGLELGALAVESEMSYPDLRRVAALAK